MSPALVASLARRFPNFVLFKDTSGADRVTAAQAAGLDLEGVFLVRGAEGGYAAHLRPNGGGYDGLLLSTANSFGAQLSPDHRAVATPADGWRPTQLSSRLSALVTELFAIVSCALGREPLRQRGQSRRSLLRLRTPGPCRTAAPAARGLGAAPRGSGGDAGRPPPVRSAAGPRVPRVGGAGFDLRGRPREARRAARAYAAPSPVRRRLQV